ncbi:MAG: hypothetical protein IJY28_00385 [Clostridia bacterium]|nr:hypothetical protein [Clostridia bacterium]
MGTAKNGSLQEVAARVLSRRIGREKLAVSADAVEAIAGQLNGRRKDDGTLTVAQAIVLAIGRKALEGDKTAAEYLQKLADQADDRRKPVEQPTERTVIRVRLAEEGGVTAERETSEGP